MLEVVWTLSLAAVQMRLTVKAASMGDDQPYLTSAVRRVKGVVG